MPRRTHKPAKQKRRRTIPKIDARKKRLPKMSNQRCRSTNSLLAGEIGDEFRRLERERDSERDARERADAALRLKDNAMSVMFKRLDKAGVDYSDLIS